MTALVLASEVAEPELRRLLLLRLGEEVLALDMRTVREVIEFGGITRVPLAPPALPGVLNLRGAVVPVVDLAERVGLGATRVARRTCVIVVEAEHEGGLQPLGLIVDAVSEALELDAREVVPAPAFGAGIAPEFVSGMLQREGAFVMILNHERVLALEELERMVSGWRG